MPEKPNKVRQIINNKICKKIKRKYINRNLSKIIIRIDSIIPKIHKKSIKITENERWCKITDCFESLKPWKFPKINKTNNINEIINKPKIVKPVSLYKKFNIAVKVLFSFFTFLNIINSKD